MLLRFVQWVSECDNLLNEPCEMILLSISLLGLACVDSVEPTRPDSIARNSEKQEIGHASQKIFFHRSSTLVTFRLLGAGLPINANAALDGVYSGMGFHEQWHRAQWRPTR